LGEARARLRPFPPGPMVGRISGARAKGALTIPCRAPVPRTNPTLIRPYNGCVSAEQRWVDNWLATGAILNEQRQRELRALTPEMLLTEALFSMPWPADLMARRRGHSGLVDMQDLLRPLRPRCA